MTDREILEKVLEKASENSAYTFLMPVTVDEYTIYYTIFQHSFAKAFWGEEEVDDVGRTLDQAWEEEWKDSGHFTDLEDYKFDSDIDFQIAWRYHLEKMVTMEEPLKYLEKYL